MLDAVIGLPPNLFYSTAIPACILVFRAAPQHDGHVLFIDASRRFRKGRNQNDMTDDDVAAVVAEFVHEAPEEQEGV